MPDAQNQPLLDVLLDSWDRSNTIMLNLLRALPAGGDFTPPARPPVTAS